MLETFPRVFCFRKSRINENGDNTYIALLPNPVGSTAKTSLPWHAILWMHSICSSLRVLWTKLWREAFKADKNSLSSLASSDVMMEFISSREFFNGNHTATKVTNHGSVLSTFLFLDQSEKSPDSGLATDKYSSDCIRRTFPPDRRLRHHFPHLHNTKTWISLKRKKILQKRKTPF